MSARLFEIEVAETDTFETADVLDRKPLADSMAALVKNSPEPLVIALDGDWGVGKTFFLRLWEKMLSAEGVPVVYFNAFANDYSDDAFVSLSSSMLETVRKNDFSSSGSRDEFVDKASKFAKIVGRSALNIAVKATTAGIVDVVDMGAGVDAAIEQSGQEAHQHIKNLIKDQSQYHSALKEFRESLATLRTAMQSQQNDFPLVIVIDELDRCRPDFAVDILECVKHFFETEKTHFVLGVNKTVLSGSIETIYGSKIDGKRYLDRFLDYVLSFSPPERSSSREQFVAYAKHIWNRSENLRHHGDVADGLSDVIALQVYRHGGTFRDINKIFSIVHLSFSVIDRKVFRSPPIIGGLVVMKYFNQALFQKALNRELSYSEVSEFFDFRPDIGSYSVEDRPIQWMHEWWSVLMGHQTEEEQVSSILRSIRDYSFFETDEIVHVCARSVVERYWQS